MTFRSGFLAIGLALCAAPAASQGIIGVNGGAGGGYSASGAVVSIDPVTGAATVLGTPFPGVGLTGVATDSSGNVYAVTGTAAGGAGPRLIRIDPATGAVLANVGRLQTAGGSDCFIGDISFQPGTDVLFGILGNNGPLPRCGINSADVGGHLLTINTTTAQVTVVGRAPGIDNSNGGLAFAPNGTLYFTPCWDNPGNLHTLNPATAAVTSTVPLVPAGTCYMGLAVRPSDSVIFASFDDENNDNNLYTLNPASGARTLFGDPGNYLVHDLTFVGAAPPPPPASAAPIPAQSPWMLLLIAGLLGLLAVTRLQRRRREWDRQSGR